MVIASVIAILGLIVGEALPVFWPARAVPLAQGPLPASMAPDRVAALELDVAVGSVGKHGCAAHIIAEDGEVTFVDLQSQEVLGRQRIAPPSKSAKSIVQVEQHAGQATDARSRYSLLWSDGSINLVEITVAPKYIDRGEREMVYGVRVLGSDAAKGNNQPVRVLARYSEEEKGGGQPEGLLVLVRLLRGGEVLVMRQVSSENLLGEQETKSQEARIDASALGRITAMTMDRAGSMLYAGTENGRLARWEFDKDGEVVGNETVQAFDDARAITSLAMVFGDVSLAVGDSAGGLTTWFRVRSDAGSRLTRIHDLTRHKGPVQDVLTSMRTKSVLSRSGSGMLHLDYPTSQRHLLTIKAEEPLTRIALAPRGDAMAALTESGQILAWTIDAPHPEVSWSSLFGKVHYEGYPEATYTWQTTGSEDSEAKLSIVPLLFGTLKGTFYAMLFAVPLALFGAAYTAHFTTPAFKRNIKPVVEIMAALPSVVIGFLIGVVIAPWIERGILAVFLSLITVPVIFLGFMLFWQRARRYDLAKRVEGGFEFLALAPVVFIGVGLAWLLMGPVESLVFGGSFKQWLAASLGMGYDQRNAVIIAFGLGFAVIPIIFSISEDALTSVPHNLTAASMALGGSRWQTLWRVILPSASPGIFAAVMIGLGRAVGETMIVLMATGNTPILDWSPFNGMRTLSANIAVEAPEAPHGGTLYRVLFLCAVLLFVLTFLLNTTAEVVRQRLRKRYGRF